MSLHPNSNVQNYIDFLNEHFPDLLENSKMNLKSNNSKSATLETECGLYITITRSIESKFVEVSIENTITNEIRYYKSSWAQPLAYRIRLVEDCLEDLKESKENIKMPNCKYKDTPVSAWEAIELVRQSVNVKASNKLTKDIVIAQSLPLIEFVSSKLNYDFFIPSTHILIGDIDVPKPLDYLPVPNITLYYPNPHVTGLVGQCNSMTFDKERIKLNMYHLTKEAAYTHAQALILVSNGTVSIENES